MVIHIYRAISWSGELRESVEMNPQWWSHPHIPYSKMWPDNQFWLHHVSIQDVCKLNISFRTKVSGSRGTESSGVFFIQRLLQHCQTLGGGGGESLVVKGRQ